jgi:hypothetical protein
MSVPNPTCTNCGQPLSTDELRGDNCRYCGTALPHRARAAEQVAVVNQIMAQHGVPGWGGAFGAPPAGGFGGPMPPNPYANAQAQMQIQQLQMQAASRAGGRVAAIMVTVGIVVALFAFMGAGMAFWFLRADAAPTPAPTYHPATGH